MEGNTAASSIAGTSSDVYAVYEGLWRGGLGLFGIAFGGFGLSVGFYGDFLSWTDLGVS
jgi:hypothetical protein